MKFSDENKQVKEFENNWLDFGVHEVTIGLVERGFTGDDEENGKEFVEFTVIGPNDEEDTARVWFSTDAAANYSFNTCRQIYVHNAPEEKKNAARDTFDAVKDTIELVDLLQKLVGTGKCWFSKYPSATRTYQAADGSTKKSIDKNVYGYKPKEHPELLPKDGQKEDLNATFPGSEEVTPGSDAAAGIPKDW